MLEEFETERLILRHWYESDAEALYEYAKDPLVGPAAGWSVHTSVENSREIIRNVLSGKYTYAVVLKGDDRPIGSIGLMIGAASNQKLPDTEAEIGYWIGVPFWGNGYIPEAMRALMKFAFRELGMTKIWCGYFDGNEKSKRVQEKCGLHYHHTNRNVWVGQTEEHRVEHVTCITREEWEESL